MCLTMPQKVISISDKEVIAEDINGHRQTVRSMLDLTVGDYVVVQQGYVTDKMLPREAHEIFTILTQKEANQ
jgi:hydrogenase maturation factor